MSKKVLWLTTSSMNIEPIMGALESVEEFDLEISHFRYDTDFEERFFDETLVLKVAEHKPDCVFYIGSLEGPYLPRPQIFHSIQEICPIVNIVFDGACSNGWPTLKNQRENKCFSTVVNIDGEQNWPKGENDLTLLCPIDPRPYQREAEKTIDLGFYGGSASYERIRTLEELEKRNLITQAKRDENLGSYHMYVDFMLRCKSVLNMARTGSGKMMHVKARVIETGLARACLLEPKFSPTRNWFKPDVDYIEYSGTSDLVRIIHLLQKDPVLRKTLAESLHKKVITQYSPERFFRKVFEKIGLEIPIK